MKGWSRKRTGEAAGDVGRTAVLGCLVAAVLAGSVAVVSAATTLELGPKVGDILVFRPGTQLPPDWEFAAVNEDTRVPGSCNLRPNVMASRGGSLVVEQRIGHPGVFGVHWAGQHTSTGAADCGSSADLVVSGQDLQLLINAVGGAGVEPAAFGHF